jgi:hypothetical protein
MVKNYKQIFNPSQKASHDINFKKSSQSLSQQFNQEGGQDA